MSWRPEAIAELIRLARAGEPWAVIGATVLPNSKEGGHHASVAFSRYATKADVLARKASLKARGDNRPKQYRKPANEPLRERVDPWAGMGNCFG